MEVERLTRQSLPCRLVGEKLIKSPFGAFSESRYRPCLQEFYADWAPEKLGGVEETLGKYEGREKQLFAKLQKKYGKKANLAKCS